MGIFSRKKTDNQATDTEPQLSVTEDGLNEGVALDSLAVDQQPSATTTDEPQETRSRSSFNRVKGPFDADEVAADLDGRLDFGAIAIVPEAGMELRLDIDEEGQEITGLTAILGQGACQMQAFAAPKTSGLWDDIRDEIRDNLVAAGGTAEELDGPLGIELQVRMPAQGEDGRVVYNPARFLGVDGPRWFLRAVLSGAAATDPAAAAHLEEFVRRTVVIRGGEPRAPREMLPLRVPEAVEQQQAQSADEAERSEPEAPRTADDFKPFDRGPEITEVR